MRCVGFWRVYEATVRINGAGSMRGEVEWHWVRGVMEVGESYGAGWVRIVWSSLYQVFGFGGVKRWEYREETNIQKSWSGGSLSVFNFITEVPLETPICCLKSAPSTFQKTLFKHGFWSNNFQTALFWKRRLNTFFKILDTSVQCLNTEHCVLKRVTKRALNL